MPNSTLKGKIFTSEIEDLRIHTYVSPEETFKVTTQIIETPECLIVFDTQFFLTYAKEVVDYIKQLSKPVECVVITHSHPDHWLGLELFAEYQIISLPAIVNEIGKIGDVIIKKVGLVQGNKITSKKIVPESTLKQGENIIGGLKIEIELIIHAEGESHVLAILPNYGVLIAQDLAYNNIHLFIGNNHHDNWLVEIDRLAQLSNINMVLAGHGEPTTKEVFKKMRNYLNCVKLFLTENKDSAALKSHLIKNFPEYRSSHLIDISNDYLFHGEHKI